MSAYTYSYTKIGNLELNSDLLQNFYGKVVYIHEHQEGETIVLLKDETASIYLYVTNNEDQKLDFELRQIVRIHRCRVRMNLGLKMAMVAVGKSGCHLVAWSQFGNTEVPAIISSKNWTRSEQDSEEIRLLSGPVGSEKNKSPTNREAVVATLQYYRVVWRIVEGLGTALNHENGLNDISLTQQEELNDPPLVKQEELNDSSEVPQEELNLEQIYETLNEEQNGVEKMYEEHIKNLFKQKIGAPIESEKFFRVNGVFPIDTTPFNEISIGDSIKFVQICNKCIVKRCSVLFTTGSRTPACECGRKWHRFKMTFRVRISSATHNLFFNIPIDQIKGGLYKNYTKTIIEMFDCHEKRDEFNQQMEQLRRTFQNVFVNIRFTSFKGFVVAREQETKTIELYLTHFKLWHPTRENTIAN
ncbi:unnamed protein product [Caenorhabditis brenneri]